MEEETEIIEALGKGQINMGRVLMIHVSRVGNRGSEDLDGDPVSRRKFCNSIKTFEEMLSKKWLTKRYWERKKEIMEQSDPYDRISDVDEWFDLFGELMYELYESDLMPAEDIEVDDVGVGPIESTL